MDLIKQEVKGPDLCFEILFWLLQGAWICSQDLLSSSPRCAVDQLCGLHQFAQVAVNLSVIIVNLLYC